MKTLILADLHLTDKQEDSYRWDIFPFIKEVCDNYGIGTLKILGDLTEKKNYHSDKLINRIREEFSKLACSRQMEIIVLKGNHDYDNCSENSFFKFLGELDYLRFWDKIIKDKTELFLPHTRNTNDWKTLDFTKYKTVYMHQCIIGSKFANGYISDKGINIKDLIPENVKVYSGDIHVPQTIGNNFKYVGAPYSIKYGDHYDGRVLIIEEGKEDIEILPGFLKNWSVKIKNVEDLEKYELRKGDRIKVEISLYPYEFCDWESRKKEILVFLERKGLEVKGVSMKPIKVKQRPRLNMNKEAIQVNEILDDTQWVNKYCVKEDLGEDYKEVGLNLMH